MKGSNKRMSAAQIPFESDVTLSDSGESQNDSNALSIQQPKRRRSERQHHTGTQGGVSPPPLQRASAGPLSTKDAMIDVSALMPFIGCKILCDDGQYKASAMRFIVGSTMAANQAVETVDVERPISKYELRKLLAAIHNTFIAPQCGGEQPSPRPHQGDPSQDGLSVEQYRFVPGDGGEASADIGEHVEQCDDGDDNGAGCDDQHLFVSLCHVQAGLELPLQFNRMSGMVEFRNGVALFVNLDQSTYSNLFAYDFLPSSSVHSSTSVEAGSGHSRVHQEQPLEARLAFTFFAQPRHHRDSPLIQRMVRGIPIIDGVPVHQNTAGCPPTTPSNGNASGDGGDASTQDTTWESDHDRDRDDDGDGDDDDDGQPFHHLLFVRISTGGSRFSHYTYMGPITPISVSFTEHPIKFVFHIHHLPRLLRSPVFLQLIAFIQPQRVIASDLLLNNK